MKIERATDRCSWGSWGVLFEDWEINGLGDWGCEDETGQCAAYRAGPDDGDVEHDVGPGLWRGLSANSVTDRCSTTIEMAGDCEAGWFDPVRCRWKRSGRRMNLEDWEQWEKLFNFHVWLWYVPFDLGLSRGIHVFYIIKPCTSASTDADRRNRYTLRRHRGIEQFRVRFGLLEPGGDAS